MAHEITERDGLVLTGRPAWHGLGTVVENAPSAVEALGIARLNWSVLRTPVAFQGVDLSTNDADDYRANVRSDTGELFAIVGKGYAPVQNAELAEFTDAMGADGSVKIESAGSIRGGRRVWFLARGESVWATERDEVRTYLMVANGHDGTLAMTVQPTSVRVVCRNTLHMALARGGAVRLRHGGDMSSKLNEARRALGLFTGARADFANQVKALNARDMSREELQRYWVEVYSDTVEPIPSNPTTAKEREAAQDARQVLNTWARNWDVDRQRVGGAASAWTALQAVTDWFDHQRLVRAKDSERAEARVYANMWGVSAEGKASAFKAALALV